MNQWGLVAARVDGLKCRERVTPNQHIGQAVRVDMLYGEFKCQQFSLKDRAVGRQRELAKGYFHSIVVHNIGAAHSMVRLRPVSVNDQGRRAGCDRCSAIRVVQ